MIRSDETMLPRPAGGVRIVVSRAEAPTNRRRHDAPLPGSFPCLARPGASANGASPMLWYPLQSNSSPFPTHQAHVTSAWTFLFSCTLVHSSRSFVAASQPQSFLFVSVAVRQSSPATPPAFCNISPGPTLLRELSPHPKPPASGCILSPARPPHPCVLSRLTRLSSWRRKLASRTPTPIAPADNFVSRSKPSHPGLSNLPE
jgi:hypothetical protein